MAETQRFELWEHCCSYALQAHAFDRSATFPFFKNQYGGNINMNFSSLQAVNLNCLPEKNIGVIIQKSTFLKIQSGGFLNWQVRLLNRGGVKL